MRLVFTNTSLTKCFKPSLLLNFVVILFPPNDLVTLLPLFCCNRFKCLSLIVFCFFSLFFFQILSISFFALHLSSSALSTITGIPCNVFGLPLQPLGWYGCSGGNSFSS